MIKFNSRQILGVGSMVLFNVVWGTYWLVLTPKLKEAETLDQTIQEMRIQTLKLGQAKKRDATVRNNIKEMEKEWGEITNLYTPPISPKSEGIDLSKNRWQITVDVQNYARILQSKLNKFMSQGGVTLVKAATVPSPPLSAIDVVEQYFNYPSISFPVAVLEMGEVCVKGTYSQLIAHLKSWSSYEEAIPLIHQIKIAGTTPDLYVFYQLVLVVYVKAEKIAPKVPEDAELGKVTHTQGVKK